MQLNKAEHPWVRSQVVMADMAEEQRETALLYGKFQAILNKLTPQKFQRLAEQALLLDINTEERLKGCVNLIITRVWPLSIGYWMHKSAICSSYCTSLWFCSRRSRVQNHKRVQVHVTTTETFNTLLYNIAPH